MSPPLTLRKPSALAAASMHPAMAAATAARIMPLIPSSAINYSNCNLLILQCVH